VPKRVRKTVTETVLILKLQYKQFLRNESVNQTEHQNRLVANQWLRDTNISHWIYITGKRMVMIRQEL